MASFVGSFAASHGPLLIREWQAVPAAEKSRLEQAFAELGRRLRAANPDVLVVVSPDHWSNFFLDNYPAICIGVGAAHEGPPEPSLERCYQWGALLRRAIESYAQPLRVAVVGTGGLSHSIGEPTMGAIYEDFDRETIRLFGADKNELIRYLQKELPSRGNGSEEVRNWLVAHGAAGGRGFELIEYLPVPTVIVGCGFAAWSPN